MKYKSTHPPTSCSVRVDASRVDSPNRIGQGRSYGTFGELLQGVLPEHDADFLVTFPVDRWSTATFRPDSSASVTVFPPHKEKSRRLAEHVLRVLGLNMGGMLHLESAIPEGKGFASSSADLVATARAVGDAFGLTFEPSAIESFLRPIEPTDGVMYAGVAAFYHRSVRLHSQLGPLPSLTIVSNDAGGEVDTLQFNEIPKPFDAADRNEYQYLLEKLSKAVSDGDIEAVGRVSTRSAVMNAKLRPHPSLEVMQRICRDIDGLGLVVAHSGTSLGILIGSDDPLHGRKVARASLLCKRLLGNSETYRSLTFNETLAAVPAGISAVNVYASHESSASGA